VAAPASDIHAGDDLGDRATPLSGTQLHIPVQQVSSAACAENWHGASWDVPEPIGTPGAPVGHEDPASTDQWTRSAAEHRGPGRDLGVPVATIYD
jgi:hypothetical protein